MSDSDNVARDSRDLDVVGGQVFARTPPQGLLRIVQIIYGLHALAIVIGVVGAASILGSFLFGFPSIAAVILNYVKRSDARGTWLESHFDWQIATFWWAAGGALLLVLMAITIIGIPFAVVGVFVLGVWLIYRVVRGWLALNDRRPLKT